MTVLAPSGDSITLAGNLIRSAESPFVMVEQDGHWVHGVGTAYEVILDRGGVRVRGEDVPDRYAVLETDPLQQVAAALADCPLPSWTALGWASFELGHLLHGAPERAGADPLLHLVVPRSLVRHGPAGVGLEARDPEGLLRLAQRVARGPEHREHVPRALHDPPGVAERYRHLVAEAAARVRSGGAGHADGLQKVVLSRTVEVPWPVDLAASFEQGRRANTPALSFAFDLGGYRAAGFSPELVVEADPHGLVSTRPLAGTCARAGEESADAAARLALLHDTKEIHEHAISARAAYEQLDRVCVPGSTRMGPFMEPIPRGSVYHLASRVTGRLAADRNAWHALACLFPGVTATGVPAKAACAAIGRLEDRPRGPYGGTVLRADSQGALQAALILRAVYQRHGRTWLRAGAGVVGTSAPEREYEETREKLRSMSRFLVPSGSPMTDPATTEGVSR